MLEPATAELEDELALPDGVEDVERLERMAARREAARGAGGAALVFTGEVVLSPDAEARCRVVGPDDVDGSHCDVSVRVGVGRRVCAPDTDPRELGGRRLGAEFEVEGGLAGPAGGGAERSRDCERERCSRRDGEDERRMEAGREEEPEACEEPALEDSEGGGSVLLRGGRPPVDIRPERRWDRVRAGRPEGAAAGSTGTVSNGGTSGRPGDRGRAVALMNARGEGRDSESESCSRMTESSSNWYAGARWEGEVGLE